MTKEEIVKELDKLGNVLYNKFGTDSYLERCTIHDLKAKIKVLIIADVSKQRELLIAELKEWELGYVSFHNLEKELAEKLLKAINCG